MASDSNINSDPKIDGAGDSKFKLFAGESNDNIAVVLKCAAS